MTRWWTKNGQSGSSFNPGILECYTKYYWKIISVDNHGEFSSGPVWKFTTTSNDDLINIPPVADASAGEPYNGSVGEVIIFDGSNSYDYDGEIIRWIWDFGDRNTSEGEITNHTYNLSGKFDVNLTVVDDVGGTDTYYTVANIGDDDRSSSPVRIISASSMTNGRVMVSMEILVRDFSRYIIDWGDSFRTEIPVNTDADFKGLITTLSHRYTSTNGENLITVYAVDDEGIEKSVEEFTITLQEDAEGSVNGGEPEEAPGFELLFVLISLIVVLVFFNRRYCNI